MLITQADQDYKDYRKEVIGSRLPRANKNGAVIVAGFTSAFIAIDWLAFEDFFLWMLWIRLACIACMLCIATLTAHRFPRASCMVGVLVSGLMLLEVIRVAGGSAGSYAPGLMLLFLGMPVLLPLKASEASLIVFVLVSGLVVVDSVSTVEARTSALGIAFPLAAGLESIVACALLERMRFSDYKGKQQIERARDELAELDAAKSRFTANVHHELRTPLTLTLAPVEAMLAGDFGELNSTQRSYLETVRSNALRLLKLINNLLDLAKVESGQLEVKRRAVRVGELAEEIVAGARPLAERKGVRLETEGLGSLPEIHADPDAFEKIVVNLLGNALKFTERGGTVCVRGWAGESEGVHLVVADTGLGIPASQLARIFDRFAQVDSSSTRRHEGTGIGLALVKELVELHGGRVWAESEGEGQGAQLHVLLPAGASDAADMVDLEGTLLGQGVPAGDGIRNAIAGMGAEVMEEESGEAALAGRLRLTDLERNAERTEGEAGCGADSGERVHPDGTPEVLVVEDNVDMRRLLHHLVGREFRVRVARNGREGLEAARERHPDLILTDVMMPEFSGAELCAAVKSDPTLNGVPVVLVTSKAEREMKIQGLELGADDYVTKPFHPRELMARIRSLVRLRQTQQELAVRNALLESTNEELLHTMDELKEAGARLVHAERLAAVGELAAGVAHEINNPVNFAVNAARTLRATVEDIREVAGRVAAIDPRDPDAMHRQIRDLEGLRRRLDFDQSASALAELADIVTEGLERTAGLVGDLRDFAAPGARVLSEVDLARSLRTTLRLVGHTFASARVEIQLDLPSGLPLVRGDARALNQVLLNLLKNAAESFDGAGGSVRVSAWAEGNVVTVEIRDYGRGMPEDVRERLFEPFFTTKTGRGTGLGLSISQRIVHDHGGRIEVDSDPGSGTAMRLHLPVACAEPADAT